MSKVFIRKASYDYALLKPVIYELMDLTCGHLINKNSKVLIKPNLLSPEPPETAIITHPLVIKSVAEYTLDKGGRVLISDSPPMASFEKIIIETGIKDEFNRMDVEFREFRKSVKVDIGEPFGKIDIAEDAMNADVFINLPKLKTHAQMLLTLGVKNTFGCIVGMKKPEWHFRVGIDRDLFAKLIVQIHKAVNPTVTIIDGILAMEGQGPGKSGIPRELGILLASADAVSLDASIAKMLGLIPDELPTNLAARELGLTKSSIIDGDIPNIKKYELPEITPLIFGPKKIHRFMRKHIVQRPVQNESLCRFCGKCWKFCPAKAITAKSNRLHFDYKKCIRCYCCIEVCPYGALTAKGTVTGKILRRILKIT
ncbi:MAG: DUF362 domain-containing protein [Nitrospiraceae bacterium]|nr:DUF362 domain-containing protein [Nitrospiraceae bacterium]